MSFLGNDEQFELGWFDKSQTALQLDMCVGQNPGTRVPWCTTNEETDRAGLILMGCIQYYPLVN